MTAFDPQRLVRLPARETRVRHEVRDTLLYALGVGVSNAGATTAEALRHGYEAQLATLPTMAVVMAWPGFWLSEPQYGVDWKKVLHAEQSLVLHAPLPAEGDILSHLVIERIVDKGAAKGSILYSRREISDAASGQPLATERRATFLRGDGGHGDALAPGLDAAAFAPLQDVPSTAPDLSVTLTTRDDQALLYRLSGDRNPLHADPQLAQANGFRGPILHGLCTYGVAARALLQGCCGGDAARFARMDCRFSQPVYPGATLVTDIWREGEHSARFRTREAEGGAVVLSHGRFDFH
jgi:acyl dehydratase